MTQRSSSKISMKTISLKTINTIQSTELLLLRKISKEDVSPSFKKNEDSKYIKSLGRSNEQIGYQSEIQALQKEIQEIEKEILEIPANFSEPASILQQNYSTILKEEADKLQSEFQLKEKIWLNDDCIEKIIYQERITLEAKHRKMMEQKLKAFQEELQETSHGQMLNLEYLYK